MDHRVPRAGVRACLVLLLAAAATFVFLNSRFAGPADPLGAIDSTTRLTATFANTKKLPTKQPLLYKGLAVGRVEKVSWVSGGRAGEVTFALDDDFELHDDAVLRIGERSLLGDPFLDVVTRGSAKRPLLGDGDEVVNTVASVNFDEALDFLGADGRSDVQSVLATVARGVRVGGQDERLNGTVGGVSRTVTEAHAVTRALRGQEEQIARLVTGAEAVLDEVGSREAAVRTIVGSGRTTLDALASDVDSLEQGLAELPPLLDAGRRSLAAAQPLVSDLREPVRKLGAAAPDLARALDPPGPASLRGMSADLVTILDDLPALRKTAVPVLRQDVLPLMGLLQPLVKAVEPAARSLLPALEYLAAGEVGTSRAEAIAGLYASIGAANKGKLGSRGHYTRAGFSIDLNELTDVPADDCPRSGLCYNAYPKSGDALDPQPFEGDYPRIVECQVPPRTHPRRPCQ